MLKELAADGELEILTHGGGDQQRVVRLRRYAAVARNATRGGNTAMSRGVVTPRMSRSSDSKDVTGVVTSRHRQNVHNSHITAIEQPINKYSFGSRRIY